MYTLDYFEPVWMANYYHIIGVVSIVCNIFGIYLLIFQTKELGEFRYYLLLFQVVCTMTDLCFTTLMKFYPFYPINSLGTMGYLSKWFDMPTHYCILIAGVLTFLETECLAACFFQKHQKIAIVLDTRVFPKYAVLLLSMVFLCYPIYPCIGLQLQYVEQDEQLEYIKKNLRDYYEGFSNVSHFSIYIGSPLLYSVYAFVFIVMCTVFSFLVFLNTDLVRLMVHIKSKISAQNFTKHKEAIRSLIVQMIVAAFCSLPICGVAFLVGFEINNSQKFARVMFVIWTSHSTINMFSLFIFFPPYRRYLKRITNRDQSSTSRIAASSVQVEN